ncbi:MAG: hypothetical protein JSS53_08295, partial [Proteobacteria bacterium]|nr:hypothetical protein [Pseudomonadota bacterium]
IRELVVLNTKEKQLESREDFADQTNELLRLAISNSNKAIAERLMAIPAVKQMAERNDYYQDDQSFDVEQLVRDGESPITAFFRATKRSWSETAIPYSSTQTSDGSDRKAKKPFY